jgi:hypothetical protein
VRKVSQRLASKKAFTYVWASLHTLAITFCWAKLNLRTL